MTKPTAAQLREDDFSEEQIKEGARALLEDIQKDPFLMDFARRAQADTSVTGGLHEPEDVLGEQAMVATSLAYWAYTGKYPAGDPGHAGMVQRDRALVTVAANLYAAVPYLWLTSIQLMVMDHDVPPHVFAIEQVPGPMWWTFEHDGDLGKPDRVAVGMLWFPHSRGVECVIVAKLGDEGYIPDGALRFHKGFRYPEDIPATAEPAIYKQVLAMLSFLNSPYIPKTSRQTNRKLRKSLGRKAKDVSRLDRRVHFVDLRSPWPTPHVKGEGGTVEYRHRWLVRGHHRAQWYPSLSAHKVIWISPYVKGPEDAPLSAPAYRVAR